MENLMHPLRGVLVCSGKKSSSTNAVSNDPASTLMKVRKRFNGFVEKYVCWLI
jgi:hypothetical protein